MNLNKSIKRNSQDERTWSVCLDTNEKLKFFYYIAYFCYYLWVLLYFLVLFMDPAALFQLTFILFTVFSAISFLFQQNKQYSNRVKIWK